MNLRALMPLWLGLTLSLPLSVQAEEVLDWLQPPPRAQVAAEGSLPDVERRYPLSALRRISGRLRLDDAVTLNGRLSWKTWALAEDHDAAEAFAGLRQQLQHADAHLLFWCEGRDCGPSSLWVTRVFDAGRLVAPDDQQSSLLVQLKDSNSLLALYAVTRGNRRGYLHVEQLDGRQVLPELQPSIDTLLMQLRDSGELALPGALQANDPRIPRLVQLLQRDTRMRVVLVSQQARVWRDALVSAGVHVQRLDMEMAAGPQDGLLLRWLR